jgi:hypothetical protein
MFIRNGREGFVSCVKVVVLLFMVYPLLQSCEKSEGPGGNASISGRVMEQFYNDDFSVMVYEMPAVDEDIFIVYGDQEELGDRVRTNHLGQFRFRYLYPGNYQVYFLSDDSSSVLDVRVGKLYDVELGRGEEADLGTLEKLSRLDFDDGAARIRGVIKVVDYVDTSSWPNLVIDKIYYATEQEVYLTYNNHTFYDERIRSQEGGVFEFGNLIPGAYRVFLYSDDVTGETDKVTLTFDVTITGLEQLVDLGEIVIEKR